MELHERQKAILGALVREYVKTAHPISSKDLLETHQFSFSSATIRNDFQILDTFGYLRQPHVSAGRVPTDKAYRFYISEHDQKDPDRKVKALKHFADTELGSDEEFLRSAASILSQLSGSFTTAGIVDDRLFFKYGFSEALSAPEFASQEMARDFGRYIDGFEEGADALFDRMAGQRPEVFIGKENPMKGGKEYGMIVYAYERDTKTGKKKQIVSILGPRRMDYEKNISLMEEFDEVVRRLYLE